MNVPCNVSAAEMREAFRLNLTPAFWWKAAIGNFRAILYLFILFAVIGAKFAGDKSIEWTGIAILFAIVALLFGFYLFRLHSSIQKTAKKLNASCNSLNIDARGITAAMADGSNSFTPWSAIKRWREGKLVFTIGDAKAFRTISKSALGEVQSGQLHSILLSQIR